MLTIDADYEVLAFHDPRGWVHSPQYHMPVLDGCSPSAYTNNGGLYVC
jgi:hypothetical protein